MGQKYQSFWLNFHVNLGRQKKNIYSMKYFSVFTRRKNSMCTRRVLPMNRILYLTRTCTRKIEILGNIINNKFKWLNNKNGVFDVWFSITLRSQLFGNNYFTSKKQRERDMTNVKNREGRTVEGGGRRRGWGRRRDAVGEISDASARALARPRHRASRS